MLLSSGSIFLLYQSFRLLIDWPKIQSYNTIEVLIYCFLANLFILGAFAFAGFAWPTYKFLPDSYYQIKQPCKLLRFANNIGVPIFQNLLLLTFWRDKKQRKRYFDGTRTGIKNWIKESKSSEFGHLIPSLILLGLSIWSLLLGFWKMALVNFVLNSSANFYPVLLQRMHRARINKIIDRL